MPNFCPWAAALLRPLNVKRNVTRCVKLDAGLGNNEFSAGIQSTKGEPGETRRVLARGLYLPSDYLAGTYGA